MSIAVKLNQSRTVQDVFIAGETYQAFESRVIIPAQSATILDRSAQ